MEVIVLAGGLGTRLRQVLPEIPKCLAPIAGKPFLAWLLDYLAGHNVNHIVFAVGYLHQQVETYLHSREWPFNYDFSIEQEPLGTGGAIKQALQLCQEEKVFVVNGDTFYPVDLRNIPFTAPLNLALKPLQNFNRYGSVQLDGILVRAFHEKAPCKEGLINGGVYAIDRSRLDLESLPERFSFEREVLEPGAAIGQVGGYVSNAYFIDIGVPEDYVKAQWAIPAYFAVKEASMAVLKADADTLFLDRDGVLNRHRPDDYVKSWAEWKWMPGVLEELPKWAAKFRNIVLVTNQRGVGKGLMSDDDLAAIHSRMMADIIEAGGRIDLILTCTDVDSESPRRKPNIGMYQEACALLDIKNGVMLGDSSSDAAFAANCGIPFILLSPEGVS